MYAPVIGWLCQTSRLGAVVIEVGIAWPVKIDQLPAAIPEGYSESCPISWSSAAPWLGRPRRSTQECQIVNHLPHRERGNPGLAALLAASRAVKTRAVTERADTSAWISCSRHSGGKR